MLQHSIVMSSAHSPKFTGEVHLASDHAGFALKKLIQAQLSADGYRVIDDGPHELDSDDDYPKTVRPAAQAVQSDHHARAIIFGKSGQGEAMAANRLRGVRAAVYIGGNLEIIRLAREHNDTNVLSIGAQFVSVEDARTAVELFLQTPFSGEERHVRRIAMLDE